MVTMLFYTLVNSVHDEPTLTESLSCSERAIGSKNHHNWTLFASLIHVDFAMYYTRDIKVEMPFVQVDMIACYITPHLPKGVLISMTEAGIISIQLLWSLVFILLAP